MKTVGWTILLVLVMAGMALAAQDGGASKEEIPPSLKSYAGIAVFTTMLLGGAKKLWADWVKGKEPLLALAIPVALGVVSKLTGVGFGEVDWATHVVALLLAGIGSGIIHDKVVNPLIKNKETGGANPT